MKTFLAALAVLVSGISIAPSAQAACPSIPSLAGTYGYVANGFVLRNLSAGAFGNPFFDTFAASGAFTIAATGSVQVTDTISLSGIVYRQNSYGGSVTMAPTSAYPAGNVNNCLGTLVLNSGVVRTAYDFVVVQGGAKLLMVDTDQGQSITGSAER